MYTPLVSCIFLVLKYSQFRSAPLCIVRRSMLDTQSKTQLAVALDIIPFNNCHTLHCEKHVGCCRLNICQFSNAFSISNVQSIKNHRQPHYLWRWTFFCSHNFLQLSQRTLNLVRFKYANFFDTIYLVTGSFQSKCTELV